MTKKLGDLCDIARGGSPRPIQQYLTNSPDGINWIKISDASASSKYIYETKEKIKPEGVTKSRLVQKDDFLLSNSMSFGRPYIMKISGCIHDGWLVLKDKSGLFDQDYLYYFLNSQAAYKQFDNLAAGSTVRNLNTQLVKNVIIPIPPIEEQKRIVEILDKAFEGIAQAEANTRRNLINARELFDSYLNQVFTKHDQNWTQEPLGKVCTLQRGYDLPQRLRVEGKFPLVSSSGIIDSHQEAKVKAPGVVTGRSGSIGSLFYVKENFWPLNTVLYVKDFHENDPEFIFYLLKHFNLGKYASGTGVPTLNRNHVHSVLVKKPIFIEEQKNLVKSLNKLQEYQKRLETIYQRKLEAIAELKQSILEKAFTGQLSQ
ncbi:MAG: restriction endonuclease subunit S [Microcystis aeruginosa Ma_MB_F_20061100_S20]|uniref:Restriction endonuclease subunit S n=1 Tax=Microcystis aeruginosa Ma_MB_F_20061100_S20D TaxID=2486253 RepID=A0A552EFH4_MICAE|nr:MAG: restriction endonuclease subunit S [Microcystis aeruginosa Ma_MB_F_20061100_S20D]TRU39448.1 MAG: restriction endonuclease subunit S [Microcystis aeruginosa Ma_MB_F_20061100_S20]